MNQFEALQAQNILSTKLGEQAIEAFSTLLGAFQRTDRWQDISVEDIYEALSLYLLDQISGLYLQDRGLGVEEKPQMFVLDFMSSERRENVAQILGLRAWLSVEERQLVLGRLTQIEHKKGCTQKLDYQELDIEQLGAIYEQLMEQSINQVDGQLRLEADDTRRATGAHYTPRILCDFTVRESITHLLATDPSSEEILALRICDPAMGSGAFLLAVMRILSKKLCSAWLREGRRQTEDVESQAKMEIAQSCLFGVDINPRAVHVARLSFWIEIGSLAVGSQLLDRNFQQGNSVLNSFSGEFETGEHGFDWRKAFPTVFQSQKKGFDLIIGNPPFINCIRGNLDPFLKAFLKKRYPIIKGSADLSYYFLDLAAELIHPDGVIGLILPRVSMGAKALRGFRRAPNRPKPFLIYSADHYEFFYNAAIKTVIYILGASSSAIVSDDNFPTDATWHLMSVQAADCWEIYRGNWWMMFSLACAGETMPSTRGVRAVKALGFTVHGGLTTDDFYKIQVEESEYGDGLKLLTSGGIDPDQSFWGRKGRYQRFRKQKYQYPRIVEGDYSSSLQGKLLRSKRPKIIVANLTKELEAFLDEIGEYQGATATQTIFHKDDSVEALTRLCAELHSDYGNLLFHHILRYNAMHSNISVEKEFLLEFPVRCEWAI